MTVTSEYERSYGDVSFAGRRWHRRAGSREDDSGNESRGRHARTQAVSAAPPAVHEEDKGRTRKRTTCLARRDPPAGPRPGPGRDGSHVEKAEEHKALARKAASPLVTAQQMLGACRRLQMRRVATETKVQPAAAGRQTDPVALESEYRRSFQGLSPPCGPRLRGHPGRPLRVPYFFTLARARSRPRVDDHHCFHQKTREEECANIPHLQCPDPARQREATSPPQVQRRHRKLTEYQANFASPRVGGEDAGETPQVALLRQKARWYRRRAWGTNFSREHLSQLKSWHNFLWEPSNDGSSDGSSPRPGRDLRSPDADPRSPPYVEALDLSSCSASSRGPVSPARSDPIAPQAGGEPAQEAKDRDADDECGGDANGRAILVGRSSSEQASQRRDAPRRAAARSPAPLCRPASATDLRPVASKRMSAPPVARVIQGRLRHADFQHNGELGLRFRSQPSSGSLFCPDEDQRLRATSSRLLASRSAAAALLDRARRRRREFWDEARPPSRKATSNTF